MGRKQNNKNQMPLFTEPSDRPVDSRFQIVTANERHDYGGQFSSDPDEAGHEYPFVQPVYEIKVVAPRVAISLQGRAQALTNIMDFYNQNNRTRGSRVQRGVEGSAFNVRYQEAAAAVQENAELKRAERLNRFHEAVTYLAQQQELIRASLIPDDPDSTHDVALQSDLNKEFGGKGKLFVERRRKMKQKLKGQAALMGFRLTSENR